MDEKQVKQKNSFQEKMPGEFQFLKYAAIVLAALLIFHYFDTILGQVCLIFRVIWPLILGCIFAFVLNLIMVQFEKGYTFLVHRFCKTEKPLRFRRALCIVGSILLIFLFLLILIFMVIPKLGEVLASTAQAVPALYEDFKLFLLEHEELSPMITEYIVNLNIDWQNLFQRLLAFAGSGISSAFGNAFSLISTVAGQVANLLFALIFAIYILAGKERLTAQFDRLLSAIFKPSWKKKLYEITDVFNQSFSSFISGQCIEAVILGALCIICMTILRFPYASVIGTLVGATALIPVLGAYIGGVVGFILIFTVNLMKAVYQTLSIVQQKHLLQPFNSPLVEPEQPAQS